MSFSKAGFRFLVSLALLSSGQLAFAKNVVVSMYGSAMSADGEGIFADDLYLKRCMAKSGWEVDSVVGDTHSPGKPPGSPEVFKSDVEQVSHEGRGQTTQLNASDMGLADLGIDTKKGPIDLNALPPDKRDEVRKRAAQLFAAQAARRAQGLEKGSNFMIDLYAHGSSNCSSHKADLVHDLAGGKGPADAQPADRCEHTFALAIPGIKGDISIKTKDMVPELEKLKDQLKEHGVHFAVNVKSCYGGAAIKDFAAAGICAQAYATADTEAQVCGGEDDPPGSNAMYAGAAFATRTGYFCRGLKDGDIFKEPRVQTPGMNETCVKGARDNAAKALDADAAGMAQPPNLIQLQESLRRHDPSANQPVGTDGPFWITNNMGLLGMTAQVSTDSVHRKANTGICEFKSANDFFHAFAKNMSEISEHALNGCSLKKPIDDFFKVNLATNQAGLGKYFDDMRAHTGLVMAQAQREKALCQQCVNNFDASFATFAKSMIAKAPETARANQTAYWNSDAGKEGYCQMIVPSLPSCTGKAWPQGKSYKDALKASRQETKGRLDQYNKQVMDDMAKTVTPMERNLYSNLVHSPEYAACLEKNPKYKEAHDACGQFRMPIVR